MEVHHMTAKGRTFSVLDRNAHVRQLKDEHWDLIVIGGGVTGCGIALDAAARGLKTVLLEKEDFASGTSSKSTKLIHGGLRYLKQFDIGLVRETGTERAIVHRLAPHLVIPEKMLLPLTDGGTYGKLGTSFGLWVYDLLAGVKPEDQRIMLNKQEALQKEPLLNPDTLRGGGYYAEYRTDDARLTLELAKAASAYGALAMNYMEVDDFLTGKDGHIQGIQATDKLSGETLSLSAHQVVSAGGPWVDGIRKKAAPLGTKHLQLTKGIHLVFPHHVLPVRQSLYFDVPDGRMVFAIPRGKVTYVGTTDTFYSGNLDRVLVTRNDADYLVSAVNAVFPSVQVGMSDIVSSWAGLRPLIHQDGKSPSELSRKDEVFTSPNGLISIAGGKLTGYRKMAKKVVDRVIKTITKKSGISFSPCKTHTIKLTPEPFSSAKEVEAYTEELRKKLAGCGLHSDHADYLVGNYGRQSAAIVADLQLSVSASPEIALACSEVRFGVKKEAVARAEDFFVRRTGRLFFDIDGIEEVRRPVLNEMQTLLSWSADRRRAEEGLLDQALHDATHFAAQKTELNPTPK